MFNTIIVQPLLNVLFGLYALTPGHDFGVSVILLTIFVRLVLWPIASKQLKGQKAVTAIQPEVKKLQEKYKDKPQELNAAVMELYKEKEVNPFGSCLLTLVQFPFLIGLFYVFRKFSDPGFLAISVNGGIMAEIYPFIKNTGFIKDFISSISSISTTTVGGIDLSLIKTPTNIALGVLAGGLQFIQSKMLLPKTKEKDAASAISSQMTYLFPLMTVYFGYILPGALALYWSVTTLFAIGQQYLIMHHQVEELEENSEQPNKKSRRNS